ncbi:MAG: metal-dependent transcriptional regulator [Spirochaetales bacterium]|nr:metal-dependent transcriptional regulator [Spirochaetales bacterium]
MKPSNTNYMYLKTIYNLSQRDEPVRSIDIAFYHNVSKPAVSCRIRELLKEKYIRMDNKEIVLTEKGLEIGEKISRNHKLFKALLESLGFDQDNADEVASLSSYVIDSRSLESCLKETSTASIRL